MRNSRDTFLWVGPRAFQWMSRRPARRGKLLAAVVLAAATLFAQPFVPALSITTAAAADAAKGNKHFTGFDREILANLDRNFLQGRRTFRFDTFGDEAFWGDTLRLHQAIAGREARRRRAGREPEDGARRSA